MQSDSTEATLAPETLRTGLSRFTLGNGSMSVCLGSSAAGGPASESGTSFTAHASAHDPNKLKKLLSHKTDRRATQADGKRLGIQPNRKFVLNNYRRYALAQHKLPTLRKSGREEIIAQPCMCELQANYPDREDSEDYLRRKFD